MPKKKWYTLAMDGMPVEPPKEYQWALSSLHSLGYRETLDSYDWVPTSEAYKRYKDDWYARAGTAPAYARPRLLNEKELGLALRVMFPEAEKTVRRSDGMKVRGFAGVKGPGALRTPLEDEAWKRRKDLGRQMP